MHEYKHINALNCATVRELWVGADFILANDGCYIDLQQEAG
jgi:hypothetical protein